MKKLKSENEYYKGEYKMGINGRIGIFEDEKEIKQKLNLLKEKLIEIMNLKNKININLMNYMLLLFK